MTTSPPSSALAYLESAANGEFIELLEEGNRLRVRCGAIGRPCLVLHATFKAPGKALAQHQRLLDHCEARRAVTVGQFAQHQHAETMGQRHGRNGVDGHSCVMGRRGG